MAARDGHHGRPDAHARQGRSLPHTPVLGRGCLANALQTYQKVVFIKEAITEDVANNMIALTLHLDSLDQKRIYYWMNCPGGEVVPTLALYDTMQYVRSKTATVCYGLCLGMGGFLLTTGGEKVSGWVGGCGACTCAHVCTPGHGS